MLKRGTSSLELVFINTFCPIALIWREMDNKDLIYFKNRIDSIDWNTDFEKADKESYEILDRLCECIKNELMKNQKSKILPEALLLLTENVGCAEDFERYEENFVNKLEEEGLLTKNYQSYFAKKQTEDKDRTFKK